MLSGYVEPENCPHMGGYFKIKETDEEVVTSCVDCGTRRRFIKENIKQTIWAKLKEVRKRNERNS